MSWTGTSKAEFEQLAELRMREARALFDAGLFDGAYYLGGYALECALKAVVVNGLPGRTLISHRFMADLHTHKLTELLALAQLNDAFRDDAAANAALQDSWMIVNGWSEQERYSIGLESDTAAEFLEALDHSTHGILPWVMHHW